ncbi:hypothetical protein EON67_05030 [archaeon]|nr:MAG: hypothetical protein EON67_05030 [archaeon]
MQATSALDSESETAIMAALREVSAGRTVITIAHRLSTMQHADEVALLSDGCVVEKGNFQDLFADSGSAFRRLVDRQLIGVPLPTATASASAAATSAAASVEGVVERVQ